MSNKRIKRLGRAVNTLSRLSPKLAGRVATRLFISPRRFPPEPHEAAYLAQAEDLKLNFTPQLHAYRWAPEAGPRSSPPRRVLLLHGWESHAGRWAPLARQLVDRGCEVFALDGPAAGRSAGRTTPFNLYVHAAEAFEAAYGCFDVLVGHSLGGGVAAQLAARLSAARRPSKVVVMAGFDETEHVFDRYTEMLGFDDRVRGAFERRITKVVRRTHHNACLKDFSNTAALRRVGKDVAGLVVHSRDDRVAPVIEAEALASAWSGAKLSVYEEEGHGLYGQDVLNEVADFVVG